MNLFIVRVFIFFILFFTVYVLNVLFCYTRGTVAALCVSMVTVRGRAFLPCTEWSDSGL